ncbi:SSA2_7 [Sanghuangporus weigelae]
MYGATIQAAILKGHISERTQDLLLLDVVPLSLSIETTGGVLTMLIKHNMTVPTKKSEISSTYVNNQPSVLIQVCEGEHTCTRDKNLLELANILSVPPGVLQIKVTFDLAANGILNVCAYRTIDKSNCIAITNDKGRLSSECKVKKAEQFKA